MPIYEFYCADCHTIFNFFSPRINTAKRPDCPLCGRPELERRVSLFAISKGRTESEEGSEGMPDIDESKMERAMQLLSQEAGKLDEEDPRQAARLMRRLFHSTGLQMGSGMEEAIRRLEAGEDPDEVEAELGDAIEQEDIFQAAKKGNPRRLLAPYKDETIYDL